MRFLRQSAASLAILGQTLCAIGADEPQGKTQTIDAKGLTFEAPTSWKSSTPKSTMRRAQLTVAPTEGDKEPAELAVFAFPGGAGTVDANVKRWQAQFREESGEMSKVASKKVKGKNVDVTRVEVAGTYKDPFAQGPAKPNYRLLGAIVESGDTSFFLKMVGPEKTMKAVAADFDALLASIQATK